MKRSYRWIAAILVIVMTFITPAEVVAAEEKGKYVSELAMADSESELEQAGYQVLKNGNLNESLTTGVYLGYKTTDDPEEAIRDAAAMNMLGKYSYGDYRSIMEEYEEQIEETIGNFLPSLEEFQQNYDNGAPKALLAYQVLNHYVNADTGELMGDYFVDYDFRAASEKEMTRMLMEANTDIVLSLMTTVMLGADTEDSTLFDRLTDLGQDGLDESIFGTALTQAQKRSKKAQMFGETAAVIRKQWNDFYQYLLTVEGNLLVRDEDGKAVDVAEEALESEIDVNTEGVDLTDGEKEALNKLTDLYEAMTETEKLTALSLYMILEGTEYGEGTLLDYFKRPEKEVEEEELYPLVFAMSEGQKGQVGLVGLKNTQISGMTALEEGSEETGETLDAAQQSANECEPISIYEGVDRSIYDEGVAFTSAATTHEDQTGESWMSKLGNTMSSADYWDGMAIASWVTTGVTLITGSVSAALMVAMYKKIGAAKIESSLFAKANNAIYRMTDSSAMFSELARCDFTDQELERLASLHKRGQSIRESIKDAYDETQMQISKYKAIGRGATVMGAVSFVLFSLSVYFDIRTIVDFCNKAEPAEEMIPHHIMTAAETEYGEDYVYYEAVKDLNGDAADMNRHEGDKSVGWLVLYTTKEKAAGKPMLARDLRVVKGKDKVSTETSFVHLFNETAALDVTSELYTGKANAGGETYILFDRDLSTLAGSAVSGGVAAIIAVGGAAVGAVIGVLAGKGARKKKEARA